jgi:hypothetical protein
MVSIAESPLFNQAYNQFRQGETGVALDPKETTLFDYRLLKRAELNKELEGRFWVGPDIAVAADATIPPRGRVFVPITLPDKLVPFSCLNHPYDFSILYATTRSRFGQLGLEVLESTGLSIAQTLHLVQKENETEEFQAIISVVNYALRPIDLPKGTEFFYPYYWDGKTIIGQALVNLLGTEVKISGVEGKDWRWWYGQFVKGGPLHPKHIPGNEVQGIELFLDPESRAWIPPSDKPITISDAEAENHNRAEVDRYLKPVPESNESLLWIAQTLSDFYISPLIHGLADRAVTQGGEPVATDDNSHHQTNAILIQGGNTSGKMRTEIFSPTTEDKIPQTVLLRFARARSLTL